MGLEDRVEFRVYAINDCDNGRSGRGNNNNNNRGSSRDNNRDNKDDRREPVTTAKDAYGVPIVKELDAKPNYNLATTKSARLQTGAVMSLARSID